MDAVRGGQYLYIEEALYNNKVSMLEYLAYYILDYKGITEIEEEKATEYRYAPFYTFHSYLFLALKHQL